jgi:hypothetical protein
VKTDEPVPSRQESSQPSSGEIFSASLERRPRQDRTGGEVREGRR